MVAAPDPDRLGRLDRLVASRDIAKVVPDIESLVQEHIFCLDSSYLCAMALGQWATGTTGRGTRSNWKRCLSSKDFPALKHCVFPAARPSRPRGRDRGLRVGVVQRRSTDAAASEDSVPRTISKARGQAAAGELRGDRDIERRPARGPGRQNPFSSEYGAGRPVDRGPSVRPCPPARQRNCSPDR